MKYGKIVVVCLLLLASGCSTTNGFFRDVKTGAEMGINITQNLVDKQKINSIAFAMDEQTKAIREGNEMRFALSR